MESIIFKNIIDKINESTSNINSYFKNIDYYDTNIYTIFEKMPKNNIIIYILIIFLIFNFISRLNIRFNEIFSLFICIIIIYYLMKKDYTTFIDFTNEKSNQLKFLHKLMFDNKNWITMNDKNFFITPIYPYQKSYLYLNPVIVQLFFDIKKISSYNISSYVNSLIHCNNVIGIEYESKIGLNREYLNYQTAILEQQKALNELNSSIYNIPESYVPVYMKSIKLLQELLNKHIYNISQLYKNNNKLNSITIDSVPNDFYEVNFVINPDDTKTKEYISVFNMY